MLSTLHSSLDPVILLTTGLLAFVNTRRGGRGEQGLASMFGILELFDRVFFFFFEEEEEEEEGGLEILRGLRILCG